VRLDLLDETGALQRVALEHSDPDKRWLAEALQQRYPPELDAEAGLAAVLRHGTPVLVRHDKVLTAGARDAEHLRLLRELGMRTAMMVALQTLDDTIGALTLVNSESHRSFNEGDLAFAQELATRAATAVHNARLYRDRR
jgi:GAF domain-containing protein